MQSAGDIADVREALLAGDLAAAQRGVDAALAKDGGNAQALALAGEVLYLQGDLAAARAVLDRAVAADPRAVEPRVTLTQLALRTGRAADAQAQALKLIELGDGDKAALMLAARTLGRTQQYEDAARAWRKMAAISSGLARPLLEACQLEMRAGRFEAAYDLVQQALEREPGLRTALVNKATILRRLRRPAELTEVVRQLAAQGADAALKFLPPILAAGLVAEAACILGIARRTLPDQREIAGLLASTVTAARRRAVAAEKAGDGGAARAAWRALLDLDPENPAANRKVKAAMAARLAEAKQAASAGEAERAESIYQELLVADPGNQAALRRGALLAEAAGDWAIAGERWSRLVTGAGDTLPLRRAARAFGKAGRDADALEAYHRLQQAGGGQLHDGAKLDAKLNAAMRRTTRGALKAFAEGDPLGAIDSVRTVLRYQPDNAYAQRNLAAMIHQLNLDFRDAVAQENVAEQIAVGKMLIAVNPDNMTVVQRLSRTAMRAGELELAVDLLKRLTTTKPDVLTHWSNLLRSLKSLHRYDEAVIAGQKALSLAPDDPKVRAAVLDAVQRLEKRNARRKPATAAASAAA